MSFMNLDEAMERAAERLGPSPGTGSTRRPRNDRGRTRMPAPVARRLTEILSTQDRPPMRAVQAELRAFCLETGHREPARATLYSFLTQAPTRTYFPSELPHAAAEALYNLDAKAPVPGHQLAFYCFNYGGPAAVSFAAGLPWLALYQAARMRGFRPKSRGLLEAVLRARGI